MGLIIIRLLVAGVLIAHPSFSDADTLQDWDIDRFAAIANASGRPWVDHQVEYPPGTVIIADVLIDDDSDAALVQGHRRLIVATLLIDGATALLLHRRVAPLAGLTYLAIGTPAIGLALVRLDLWAAFAATAALLCLKPERAGSQHRWLSASQFAVLVTVGWLIKLFPAFLVPIAFGMRAYRHVLAALTVSALTLGLWVWWAGTDAITQVVSLRDATGWHLESIPGSLTALFGSSPVQLEADAFRIGTINPTIVTIGRGLTLGLLAAMLWWISPWYQRRRTSVTAAGTDSPTATATPLRSGPLRIDGQPAMSSIELPALMMLSVVAAMIVTAPLLSPQFVLWLIPFAACLVTSERDLRRIEVVSTAATVALTAIVLTLWSPPELGTPIAAALLLARDAALIVVALTAAWRVYHHSSAPAGHWPISDCFASARIPSE